VLGVSSVAVQTIGGGTVAANSDSESSIKPGLSPTEQAHRERQMPVRPRNNLDGGGRQSPLDRR
jgi:hypothetical protein